MPVLSPAARAVDKEPDPASEAAYHFALGKLLAEEAEYQQAVAELQRALALDPRSAYGRMELARLHLELADSERSRAHEHRQQAAQQANAAREAAPENYEILEMYGQLHLELAQGSGSPDSLQLALDAYETLRREGRSNLQALASLAQIYLWQRQSDQAIEVLKEAVTRQPRVRLIHAMLVEALFDANRLQEAEGALSTLLRLDPGSLENRLRLAALRSSRGDHRGALEVLETTPETQTQSFEVRQQLARELHLVGENDRALGLIDGLLADGMQEPEALHRLRAQVLAALVRNQEAAETLRGLLGKAQDGPARVEDTLLLARLEERLGNIDRAAEVLRSLVPGLSEQQQGELQLMLAALYMRHDQPEASVDLLQQARSKAPVERLPRVLRLQADNLTRLDRLDEARDLLSRAAVELDLPGQEAAVAELRRHELAILAQAEAWDPLAELAASWLQSEQQDLRLSARVLGAEALAELGRTDEALAWLSDDSEPGRQRQLRAQRARILLDAGRGKEGRALLDSLSTSGAQDDLLFVAQTYVQAEHYLEAIPILERIVEDSPDDERILFSLGAAFERSGQQEKAVAAFQRLLEMAPDHPPALNYLGYMWAEAGENLQEALGLIRRAVALDQDNGAFLDSLGWAYYQLGRYEEARPHLEWAARLVPGDATIYEHLGDLFNKLDQRDRALAYYRLALDLEDDNAAEVRRKLELLEDL